MFEFSFLDVSGSFGLVAYGALTLNFIIGMFMSTGIKKTSYWKKLPPIVNKYPLLTIHNFTALTEGNYWETENEYSIFFYYRPFGARHDELIGYRLVRALAR